MSPLPRQRLWERDFTLLFAGRAASTTGTAVTAVALPLVAITALDATAFQAALLVTAGQLPVLLLALTAGALVDRRHRKKPVMVGADVVCAVVLATVPLAGLADALSLAQLYAVAFVLAAGGLVFDAAAHAYTPHLLGPDRLLRGNAVFGTASSATDIAGAPLAAALISLVGAAAAVGADVAGYLASALALAAVRHREPPPAPKAARSLLRADIAAGVRFVADDPVLRTVTTANAIGWLLVSVTGSVRMVYLVRELHWTPTAIGTAMACGGVGGLVGGLAATRAVARFGAGRVVVASAVLCPVLDMPLLLAGPGTLGHAAVSAALAAQLGVAVAAGVVQVSLRQARCPAALRARVTTSARWLNCALRPLGSLLGGISAAAFGVRATLVAAVAAGAIPALVLARSPVRHLDTIEPGPAPDGANDPPLPEEPAALARHGGALPPAREGQAPEAASGGAGAAPADRSTP